MQACAKKGGVVGLSGLGPFLGGNTELVGRLIGQLRYSIDLIGADHVGLGLDFVFDTSELDEYVLKHPALFPPTKDITGSMGMIGPESLGSVAEALAQDNLTDSQIRGILGENWLRVAAQVWR
jgi:membrane dipeptidase